MKICYFGDYDPEYSRNRVLIKGLKENGVEILSCNDRNIGIKKYINLIKLHKQLSGKYDIMIVGYSDSRFVVPLAKIICRKKIVWDAFYSIYDSWIFDRKLAGKYSLKAFYYWFLDWVNCVLSDNILLDTNEHIKYFCNTFKIGKNKFIRVFIGADDNVFRPFELKL